MSQLNENKVVKRRLKVKSSYVWGGVFALLLAAWLLSGQLSRTPRGEEVAAEPVVEQEDVKLTSVRVRTIEAVPHEVTLTIRGRTEALRSVQIRAETAAKVVAIPAEKGTFVREGDILCELSVDARAAQMNEARALLKQRKLEWEAAKRLQSQGHRSETQTAAIRAGYESAQALTRRMEIELERTKIRAPYAGIFDDRKVEIGDYMQPGQVCGSVVSQDPFLVVGQVSERDVSRLNMGDRGQAKLITGEVVEGHIRYIAAAADPATRTFKIELEIPNPTVMALFAEAGVEQGDATPVEELEDVAQAMEVAEAMGLEGVEELPTDAATIAEMMGYGGKSIFRDGITAELSFPIGAVPAHHLSPAALGLNTQGEVGVRIIDDSNVVSFVRVQIISDTATGVWVSGLPAKATIITVGQELVSPGETVRPIREEKVVSK